MFFESPNRILRTLEEFRDGLDDPQIGLSRELTKLHEETYRGSCSEVLDRLSDSPIRGELTLTVHIEPPRTHSPSPAQIERIARIKKRLGISTKDAAWAAALLLGVSKKPVYEGLVQLEDPGSRGGE